MDTRLLMTMTQDIGSTRQGTLTIFPVTGGSFEGEHLRGRVLAGGDWVTAHGDGIFTLDLRVTHETEDESLIHMTFTVVRDDKPLFPHGPAFRDCRAEVRVPQSSRCSRHRGNSS